MKAHNLSWAVEQEMNWLEHGLEPMGSFTYYRHYWSHFANVMTDMIVSFWGLVEWLLFSVALFSLAGNFRSLKAVRRQQAAKDLVYLHQIAIVVTDIASTFTGLFFILVERALPTIAPRLHTPRWMTAALILFLATLLTGRWVFLGSLLDRREAFLWPLVYHGLDHSRRVRRLVLASVAAAVPIAVASVYPTETLLAGLPLSPQQKRAQFCRLGWFLGFFAQPMSSPSWMLLLQANEIRDVRGFELPIPRFLLFSSVLVATDFLIGVATVHLLRALRASRVARARLKRERQSVEQREQRREDQKVKTLLWLYILILPQMLCFFAVFICWASDIFEHEAKHTYCPVVSVASSSLHAGVPGYYTPFCPQIDSIAAVVIAIQQGCNFLGFLLLSRKFRAAFFFAIHNVAPV